MSGEGILAVVDLYRVKKLRMEVAIVCRFCTLDGVGKSENDDVIHNGGWYGGSGQLPFPLGPGHVPWECQCVRGHLLIMDVGFKP